MKNMKELISQIQQPMKVVKSVISKVPAKTKLTWGIRGFGLYKLPLLAFIWPEVLKITETESVLKVPLTYRSKNHLGVMYFGALSMGAEAVVALHVLDVMQRRGQWLDFLFKDFKANFLKRAEGDVLFCCEDGEAIRKLIEEAFESGERKSATFKSFATTPKQTGDSHVADFEITLSVKVRKGKQGP
jgi:hypothetical protein